MRLAVALSLSLILLAGCAGKARLRTESKQLGSTLEVKVDVDPPAKGTLTFKGSPAFEKLGALPVALGSTLVVNVPLADVPRGKNEVTMAFAGEGRGLAKKVVATGTLSFERKAIDPTLKLVAVARSGATDISCRGALCDTGTRLPLDADAKLSVDLTDCDGCDVEVSGQKISVHGAHTVSSIDLTNAIGDASGSGLTGTSDMDVIFKITQEGETTEVPFQSIGAVLAATVFRRVARGPVTFVSDTPASSPRAAVIVRKEVGYGVVSAVGTAPHVRDYDLIGVAAPRESSLASCGTYTTSDTNKVVNVAHKGVSFDVTMYDRRTGKIVGRRSFPPDDRGCADTLVGGATVIYALPAEAALNTWARSFLK